MIGRNLREEFRRKRLKWTAIDYDSKYCADELIRRRSAGGIDRLSQSLANTSLDLSPNRIEADLFEPPNPLEIRCSRGRPGRRLGKTIEAALVQCQYWTERSRRCSSINSFVGLADVRHELRFDDRMESLRK
ncbi:hypothetical protein [Paraburkholderia dioscoreae]|uniref:Uncharacterized protein n=1 Tax=Paraburkholderia dioscoreae TaxID=2604047 RepID=A0A5Q4ZQU9_9BURK|nr:hypothetical protein [Paraburkholderia dioscoreae]VVD31060.1 protein of unknown function [Paraburkholderia dioscoreae]